MKRICFLLIILGAVYGTLSESARFDNYRVYEVSVETNDQLHVLQHLEHSTDEYLFWVSPVQVHMKVRIMVGPQRFDEFEAICSRLAMKMAIKIDNVQDLIDKERPPRRVREGFGWEDYYTMEEMYTWFDELAAQYEYLSVESYGTSYEGQDMRAVKLSKKSGNPGIFIEANIHAREWISSATATWILNQLLTSTDPAVVDLAENYDWYILPVTNPDGFRYTKENNRMWRKNRYPHSVLCYGVDLNRNFPGHWMEGGSSGISCTDTFAGPKAGSEIETQNIMKYFQKYKEGVELYLSFHSYGQYILFPFGHINAEVPENYFDWMEMAEAGAIALANRHGTLYEFGNSASVLYTVSGATTDWAHGEEKVPIAVTYEFRDQGVHGFILPADQIIPNAEEMLDSLIAFIRKGTELGYFKRRE